MVTPTSTDVSMILITVLLVYAVAAALRVGAFSLAPAAFAGVGAYTSAVLSAELGMAAPAAMTCAIFGGLLLSLVTAFPLLRSSGVYTALMSVSIVVVVYSAASSLDITGGTLGLAGVPFIETRPLLVVTLCAVVAGFWYLDHSSLGRRIGIIEHDPVLARSLSIPVARLRLLALVASGTIASVAGAAWAHSVYFLTPSSFSFALAISIATLVIVSGSDHWAAPLLAAGVLTTLSKMTPSLGNYSTALEGALAILIVIFFPGGLGAGLRRALRYRRTVAPGGSAPASPPVPEEVNLEVHELAVSYGAVRALHSTSLVVRGPGCVGVIGPNGSGKSTLVGAISSTVPRDSGTVTLTVNGRREPLSSEHIGRVFQTPRLVPNLRVWENISANSRGVAAPEHLAWQLGREVGLTDEELRAWPDELSIGTLKKAELARAMLSRPYVLLLDEPAAGLSQAEVRELATIITKVARYTLVILVEHNLNLVYELCDRVVLLLDGVLSADGSPQDLRRSELVAEAYLGTSLDRAPASLGTPSAYPQIDDAGRRL